jgi:adenosine deaminase
LHCHLEGTLQAPTFLDLTERYGFSTRYQPGAPRERQPADVRDPERVYDFADFREFLLAFAAVSRALAAPEDYARLAREYVRDALAQNVVHAELFVSPSVWTFFHPELDVRACFEGMRSEFDRCSDRLAVRLIVDLTRNFGIESGMETARLAASLTDLGVVGIGLGGDEARFPAEHFADAYAFARSEGLHRVAHAGEAAGAQSVRDAVERLDAERVGHGIRAIEDDSVVELLVRREVALECCPTSNVRTGVAAEKERNPLFELIDRGVRVTIDADDPAMFRASVTDEYAFVAQRIGAAGLVGLVENAIDASFASPAEKAAMRERLRSAAPELAGTRRT